MVTALTMTIIVIVKAETSCRPKNRSNTSHNATQSPLSLGLLLPKQPRWNPRTQASWKRKAETTPMTSSASFYQTSKTSFSHTWKKVKASPPDFGSLVWLKLQNTLDPTKSIIQLRSIFHLVCPLNIFQPTHLLFLMQALCLNTQAQSLNRFLRLGKAPPEQLSSQAEPYSWQLL